MSEPTGTQYGGFWARLLAFLADSAVLFLLSATVLTGVVILLGPEALMPVALGISALFLVSYVIYHANVGSKPFPGQGPIRVVYLTILLTHIVLAAVILHDAGPPESAADARRTIVQAVEMVADRLGNTPAIARKCYIHPFVLEAFTEGHAIQPRTPRRAPGEHDLSPQEAALLRFLREAPGAA